MVVVVVVVTVFMTVAAAEEAEAAAETAETAADAVVVEVVAATLQGLLLLLLLLSAVVVAATLLCGDELMQKEGTNSAALTFRVENLLSMDLSCDVGGPTMSPFVSACCSHESGAMLFAILISCFGAHTQPAR